MNVLELIEQKKNDHLEELKTFLRIPSISTRMEHKPDVEHAAHWLGDRLRASGMETIQIAPTPLHPILFAESPHQEGKPTVLLYGHYDVQPAEPLELWTSPAFEPEIRHGKLYARGTADDKGQIHIHLKALESLQATHGKLPVNVQILIEGEEEVGSPNLWDFVRANQDRLCLADVLVISDTSMLAPGVPSITYGLRGLNYYQIELIGPAQDLHSGLFGGAVPNPLTILARTFAQLHDKTFRVTVPGFYDDVVRLSAKERRALRELPWDESAFRSTVGAPELCGEKGFSILEQIWVRPTLELNGIWGGYMEQGAKTVIPSSAHAKFSTRLVPNQHPEQIAELVEAHIRRLLPSSVICHFDVLSTGKPWLASYTHPVFQAAAEALEQGFGRKAAFIREGGSIPIAAEISDMFHIPCVLMGFGLPDENAHAPDEHISLENYFGGIKSAALLYERLADPRLGASHESHNGFEPKKHSSKGTPDAASRR
jgi:acetylornithine deacetylase/succinyl-diaminopimelate desuccinylase-like protein